MNRIRRGRAASLQLWTALALGTFGWACGGGESAPADAGTRDADPIDAAPRDTGAVDTGPGVCMADSECDDLIFCNGAERCAPGSLEANARGCVTPGVEPCMPTQICDESSARCLTQCDLA
ncbi:MAG: hypothetical protein OEY14_08270, partial [Myxococcales bacterium]|nr:hypothetical protein [Myxococcales bacterium]